MKYLFVPLTLAAVLMTFVLPAPPAHACSVLADSLPKTPSQAIEKSNIAFVGTVDSIVQDKSVNGAYRITFSVAQAYKGQLSAHETLVVQSSSAACGYDDGYNTFSVGSVWAMYGSGTASEGYTTNNLSFNTKYDSLEKAKEALSSTSVSSPVSSPAPSVNLSLGARGADVSALQTLLITKNAGASAQALSGVGATGYFGTLTQAALVEFQGKNGITPSSGYYGPKTRAFLTAHSTEPVPADGKTVSYTGTIGCRAAKNTDGPVIALCSFGLKTDPGLWYALRTDSVNGTIFDYSSTDQVTVTGTLAPAPDDSFKAEGTIVVTKIEKVS